MNANLLSAANAYRNQLKLMEGIKDAPLEEAKGPSFSEILKEATESAKDTAYSTEATKMEALTSGKVDLTDLVTAVSNAELTLNTVVAVRDKVINAYQEIIRMPI